MESSVHEPRLLSLFSGCGGFDIGFQKKGYRCIAAIDNNELALKNFSNNLSGNTICHDLSLPSPLPLPKMEVDVLTAGPPCQGFSTVGKRNFYDPRNHLLIRTAELVLEISPKVAVIENVPGVVSGKHASYWKNAKSMLRENRYSVIDFKINMENLGLPQRRSRMFMLAWKSKKTFELPFVRKPAVSLEAALCNLEGLANHSPRYLHPSSRDAKIIRRIKPGQKLCNVRGGDRSVHTWEIPEVYGRVTEFEGVALEAILKLRRRNRIRDCGDADPILVKDLSDFLNRNCQFVVVDLLNKGFIKLKSNDRIDLKHTFNGKYRRLMGDKPSSTVDTRFISHRYFVHPLEDRGFTIRESARIQSFPDEYVFTGADNDVCRIIGNAVPPLAGEWLADITRSLL